MRVLEVLPMKYGKSKDHQTSLNHSTTISGTVKAPSSAIRDKMMQNEPATYITKLVL